MVSSACGGQVEMEQQVVAGCGVTNSAEAEAHPEGGSRLPAMYGLRVLSSY